MLGWEERGGGLCSGSWIRMVQGPQQRKKPVPPGKKPTQAWASRAICSSLGGLARGVYFRSEQGEGPAGPQLRWSPTGVS